ncbi:MAG: hypothetical protein AB1894_14630 [Chloroflexota bacterium]
MKTITRGLLLLGLPLSASSPVASPAISPTITGAEMKPTSSHTTSIPAPVSPSPTVSQNPPGLAYPGPISTPALPLPYPSPLSTTAPITFPLPPGPRPSELITATLKTLPDTGQGIKAYDFLNEQVGWVVTGMGWTEYTPSALLSTRDGGRTWELLSNEVGEVTLDMRR